MKLPRKKAKPITVRDVTIIDPDKMRKAITAAALGNAMEWFDLGVYGFLAATIGKVFFTAASPGLQLVASFGTFSVPYFVRPLGGLIAGKLGDKYGRSRVLAVTVMLMTIATFSIGLIPGYPKIGMAAPLLLLLCKMLQGFSVGGEYTGASIFIAEYAPDRKRGFLGSWIDFGAIAGFVIGAGVVLLITALVGGDQLNIWGWRIPFFLALPLGIVGLFLQHSAEETPAFEQHLENLEQGDQQGLTHGPTVPFKSIMAKHWRAMVACIGLAIATNVTYYMLLTYLPTFLSHNLGYPEDKGVLIILVIMVAALFIQPTIGFLSDRIGRRPFAIGGAVMMILLSIPAFMMIENGSLGLLFAGLMLIAIMLNCFTGIMASTVPAFFPTDVRFSALSSAFNIAIIIAGLTPTVLAWLVEASHNLMMPAYYLIAFGFVGLLTGLKMPQTAGKPLPGAAPAASSLREAHELVREHHDNIEEEIDAISEEIRKLEERKKHLIDQHPRINE